MGDMNVEINVRQTSLRGIISFLPVNEHLMQISRIQGLERNTLQCRLRLGANRKF